MVIIVKDTGYSVMDNEASVSPRSRSTTNTAPLLGLLFLFVVRRRGLLWRLRFCPRDALHHSFSERGLVNLRARVVLAPVKDPLHDGNDEDDAKGDNSIVHASGVGRQVGRKHKQDRSKERPQNTDLKQRVRQISSAYLATAKKSQFGTKI